jgi:hypothetical protein
LERKGGMMFRTKTGLRQTAQSCTPQQPVSKTIEGHNTAWLDKTFAIMDASKPDSKGKRWKREELYRSVKIVNPLK